METLILKLVISCYILPIIAYYFLIRYLYNSKIWDKDSRSYIEICLMIVPLINIIGSISMILTIIEKKKKDKTFLHKFFKLK